MRVLGDPPRPSASPGSGAAGGERAGRGQVVAELQRLYPALTAEWFQTIVLCLPPPPHPPTPRAGAKL
jgi:hypothetical protein